MFAFRRQERKAFALSGLIFRITREHLHCLRKRLSKMRSLIPNIKYFLCYPLLFFSKENSRFLFRCIFLDSPGALFLSSKTFKVRCSSEHVYPDKAKNIFYFTVVLGKHKHWLTHTTTLCKCYLTAVW